MSPCKFVVEHDTRESTDTLERENEERTQKRGILFLQTTELLDFIFIRFIESRFVEQSAFGDPTQR
jgi:hypothetical protein